MRLERVSWGKVEAYFKTSDVVVIPVGSIECHGRHNALGTDKLIPEKIVDLIEERNPDIMILPTIPFGDADWHTGFPGTISIGSDLLEQVMIRIVMHAYGWGARHFIVVNGHGGNNHALEKAAFELNKKGALLAICNWWTMVWDMNEKWKGGHGGGEETAGLLGTDPELVDKNEIRDSGVENLTPQIRTISFKQSKYENVTISIPRITRNMVDSGWIGSDHPNTATEEWGKEMLKAAADYIGNFIHEFRLAPLDHSAENLNISRG